jgi:hypothetical protein
MLEKGRKMKNFLIIVLMVVIVIVTGCGVYYQIDRFNKKDETKEVKPKTEEKVEELDVDSEEVTKIMRNMNLVNDISKILAGDYEVGYFYLKDSYKETEIDNAIKLIIALNNTDLSQLSTENDEITLNADEVKTTIKKIFGPNFTYTDVERLEGCNLITFDSQNNNYNIKKLKCNKNDTSTYKTKIMHAKKYNDRIEIEEKAIYINSQLLDDGNTVYNIYKQNKKDMIAEGVKLNIDSKEEYEKYFENTDTYKYIFKIEDGNYYFESVEKIN